MGVIYLASQSPQRAMLLDQAGVPFQVVPSDADEESVQSPHPQLLALDRAALKARGGRPPAAATGIILGADTVIALGGEIFGKPADDADARRILGRLSGSTHSVFTGHHAIKVVQGQVGAEASAVSIARVTMRRWTAEEIAAYVASGEHRGKAGAYAIQETADRFIIELQGSYGTVVGLSVTTVAKLYRELMDGPLLPDFVRESSARRPAVRP